MVSSQFFLSLVAYGLLSQAKAIPEPVITPAPIAGRQASEQALIGYYSFASNIYDSAECPFGSTWTASSTYGRCCATTKVCTAADYITRCSGNGVVYGDGLSASCSGSFSLCNTDQIIKTVDDANPTFWIGCDDDGLQTFYYRTRPVAVTVIPTTTTSRTPIPTSPSPNTPSATSTSTTTTPDVAVITTEPVPKPKKEKSKAFIAGVVVGPVALLAIIGLIVWIVCLKRSKKGKRDPHQPAQQYETQQQVAAAPQQYQQQQSPSQDPRYSAAPTYSNVSYHGSYQQPSVYSPGVSTMSSPQMPYSEGVVAHQNTAPGGYFSPDSKTPAVTTSQQGAPAPANQAYNYPPHSELQ
ncbi:hypothetical protein BKA65DRAFT_547057 [Rhexocercosporidium sp. MPI-PUGE-AT-0058]|nr:hypothetical protein BKA65DRAFT_547057 [Rhexocercosporidium sp. MPI-PUGE-AT-0058]